MKLNQLRDFLAVAEAGSLRAAARNLGVAQPGITRNIQELEHYLGAQLFVRVSRGVSLTPMGEKFRLRAARILEEARRSKEEIRQLAGEVDGSLCVAISPAGHMGILNPVFEAFRARYPDVFLHVIEGFLPAVEADLLSGAVDLYLGPVDQADVGAELSLTQLFENECVVIGRKGHPKADAQQLSQLCDYPWLTTSITRGVTEEFHQTFVDKGLEPPKIMAQCHTGLSLLTLLVSSDMLCVVPTSWANSSIMQGLVTPLAVDQRLFAPPFMMVHRAGLGLTPAAEYFMYLAEDIAKTSPKPSTPAT